MLNKFIRPVFPHHCPAARKIIGFHLISTLTITFSSTRGHYNYLLKKMKMKKNNYKIVML